MLDSIWLVAEFSLCNILTNAIFLIALIIVLPEVLLVKSNHILCRATQT